MGSAFLADNSLVQALESRSVAVPCSQGRILFKQGDAPTGLYILVSGAAELMMESNRGEAILWLNASAGSLLGLPAIVGNEPYTLTARACKGSDVKYISRSDFEEVVGAEPSLYFKTLQVLAAEVRAARRALAEI
jgi:CRP/FNR family transcriptional regulator